MHNYDSTRLRAAFKGLAPQDAEKGRGDHDLNPGMIPPVQNRPAAVLIPIVERDEGLTMLLTKRSEDLPVHPGQVSFPGGRAESRDDGPVDTALRETEEEVGIHRRHIDVVGQLDLYRTRTGFEITPVVGLLTPPFDMRAEPMEVQEIFEVPLAFFLDRGNHERHSREWNNQIRSFYAMPYGDYYIWGATAGMLVNFVDVLLPHVDA
ncbi:CoA pyrophosphatase [uncultured Nisaea sp.]|jgi:8-oxo-dGTP pyrophosphatase MutT (NUDIX family)|uniref:CoA pyrophosphatase n=1 Tax=uncultured Nisaea sp. TaxID=538215 RepID=UPI0030EEDBD0|tara:strand:+ start:474 stop:1094 length:621 start_codon:yes stop_codon:yes gene_type:complete